MPRHRFQKTVGGKCSNFFFGFVGDATQVICSRIYSMTRKITRPPLRRISEPIFLETQGARGHIHTTDENGGFFRCPDEIFPWTHRSALAPSLPKALSRKSAEKHRPRGGGVSPCVLARYTCTCTAAPGRSHVAEHTHHVLVFRADSLQKAECLTW